MNIGIVYVFDAVTAEVAMKEREIRNDPHTPYSEHKAARILTRATRAKTKSPGEATNMLLLLSTM